MIISLWVPDTLENGTESSAVLDCVYNYTEQVFEKRLCSKYNFHPKRVLFLSWWSWHIVSRTKRAWRWNGIGGMVCTRFTSGFLQIHPRCCYWFSCRYWYWHLCCYRYWYICIGSGIGGTVCTQSTSGLLQTTPGVGICICIVVCIYICVCICIGIGIDIGNGIGGTACTQSSSGFLQIHPRCWYWYFVSSDRSSCSRPLTTFSHNLLTLLKISL